MNIVNYIIEILKENDKVIVPGLGCFSIEYKACTIHPVEHSFAPPVKSIIFDSNMPNDDLLANTIAEQEHISITDAFNAIRSFSDALLSDIQKGKLAGIEGLGVFSLTEAHLIAFEPETTEISDEEFGLTGFTSPAIVRSEFKDKAVLNAQKAKEGKARRKKRNRRFVAVIAAVVVLTSLIFLVFFTDIVRNYLYNNGINSDSKTEQALIQVEKPANLPIVTADTIVKTNDSLSTAAKGSTTDEMNTSSENNQSIQYYLVAGSFKSEENANKSVAELKAKGFNQSGIVRQSKNGMFIVYYESQPSNEAATKALKQIIKTENPDSWVMKK